MLARGIECRPSIRERESRGDWKFATRRLRQEGTAALSDMEIDVTRSVAGT